MDSRRHRDSAPLNVAEFDDEDDFEEYDRVSSGSSGLGRESDSNPRVDSGRGSSRDHKYSAAVGGSSSSSSSRYGHAYDDDRLSPSHSINDSDDDDDASPLAQSKVEFALVESTLGLGPNAGSKYSYDEAEREYFVDEGSDDENGDAK